jgi:uncharacterized protein
VRLAERNNPSVATGEGESKVFRVGGISYLRIPTDDPRATAAFYANVFGWNVDTDRDEPSFEDGSGHVIGHFVSHLAVAGEGGIRPYVHVEDVDATLARAVAAGGDVVDGRYTEGDLWVATFRDPPGNVIGIWQCADTGRNET